MSRRPRAELQFGSDSFLDVVANIVGILIILIVIAGLRVSQAPVVLTPGDSSTEAGRGDDLPPPIPEGENSAPPAPVVATPPSELDAAEDPQALVSLNEELLSEIEQLEQTYRAATQKASDVRETEADLRERLAKLRQQLESREQEANTRLREIELQQTNRKQLQATLAVLRQQIQEEEKKPDPVKKLEHRVTPMSKTFTGHEQHYRLSGNRVSEVPVLVLTQRLRDQIDRRKDWLLKQRSHQGEVGPVGGYSMFYTVVRDNVSVMDEVRYGAGYVRISVSTWRIEPQSDLVTESAEEALRQGSQFYDSLLAADEGTSLTFWVYPDSYPLYRKLQEFAHEQGFLVAGRPLPHGVFISGSPNGSKSAGQ